MIAWLFLWLRVFGICPFNHHVPDQPCFYRHPFWYQGNS